MEYSSRRSFSTLCNLSSLLYKQNLGRIRGFQLQLSPGNLHPFKCFNTQSSETHLGLASLNWENLFPLKSCHNIYSLSNSLYDYCNNEETNTGRIFPCFQRRKYASGDENFLRMKMTIFIEVYLPGYNDIVIDT